MQFIPMHKQRTDPVLAWARKISKEFVSDDTLKLLKFCFGGDDGIPQTDIEDAGSFLDLFTRVLDKLYQRDVTRALSRFVYILDFVSGHRKYGKRGTALLVKLGIDKPQMYKDENEPKIVQLHYFLAAIASRLKPDHEESIRNIVAGNFGIAPESQAMKSIPALFSFLIHQRAITVEDQNELVEVLFNIRAKKSLIYLKNYCVRNNIPLSPKLKTSDAESAPSSRTPSFIPPDTTDFELNSEEMSQELNSNEKWTHEWIQKRSSSNQSVGPPELTINYVPSSPTPTSQGTIVQQPSQPSRAVPIIGERTENTPLLAEATDLSNLQFGDQRDSVIITGKGVTKRSVCIFVLIFGLLAAAVTIDVVTASYGVHHASTHKCPGTPISQLAYEGSTILLYNFSPYYVSNVILAEQLEHDENFHDIDFELIEYCHLSYEKNTTTETMMDASVMKNITALYLMPGSKISYNICAVTNEDPAIGVRLEVYVMTNLEEARYFDPKKSTTYKNFLVCSLRDIDPCSCNSFTYEVKQPNYYSVIFVPRHTNFWIQYNYTSTIEKVTIASFQNSSFQDCSVNRSRDQCSIHINDYLPHQMNNKQCIIANIKINEFEKSNYLHISVNPSCTNVPVTLSAIFLSLGLIGLLVIVVIFLCIIKKFCM